MNWWYPYAYFMFQYFLKGGILDGYAGLQYALLKFWYFNLIQSIQWQHSHRQQQDA
jgi:hypothetical protein